MLAAMETFDAIFAVLPDDDAEKLARSASAQGSTALTDEEIEALVAERKPPKAPRFRSAPTAFRDELAEPGIILEDTRDGGVRWKYK